MKSHRDTQSTLAFRPSFTHREVIFVFILLPMYIYIYIYLSLGTVLFENVYVDETSLRKTKGRVERKIILLLKMERKNLKNNRRVARKPQSWTRTRENGNSILIAPRSGRGTIFAGSTFTVSILRKPMRAARHTRDGNKYNQRTKRRWWYSRRGCETTVEGGTFPDWRIFSRIVHRINLPV